MTRTLLLLCSAAILLACVDAETQEMDAFERTIPELQAAMAAGRISSEALVQQYLDRIAAYDRDAPALQAMITVNPRALEAAAELDRERTEQGPRGPLHGIPILLKDNYDTDDMPTTAGVIAMAGFVPPDDGTLVRRLREAGAVFIGKTNLHEFARGIETISSLGGATRNPYDPRRNPGGSSGGTAAAVAANFAAVGMGSDTCGSIRIPAANNNLFGLRVTQGLSSRDGIVPLSHTQDVAGPLARSMVDLVMVLDATLGSDAADPQTADADERLPDSFALFLDAEALQGARLGLLTDYLDTSGPYRAVTAVIEAAVVTMQSHGAEVIDIQIEGLDELLRNTSVINYEFTTDVEQYLRASGAPINSVEDVLESGEYHEALEARYRNSLERAGDTEEYERRLANRQVLAQRLAETLEANDLDALVYPTLRTRPVFIGESQHASMCHPSAHSGLPAISVPAGFTADGLPVGMELLAAPYADGRLIALGYAWEQLVKPRRSPQRTPSLISDVRSYEFGFEAQQVKGELRLDRPSQTLHYALQIAGMDPADVSGLTLHRGADGTNGPVIALLGSSLAGALPIRNEDLEDLASGNLYLVVQTRDAPRGAMRSQVKRR